MSDAAGGQALATALATALARPARPACRSAAVRTQRYAVAGTIFDISGPADDPVLAGVFANFANLQINSGSPRACIDIRSIRGTYCLGINGVPHGSDVVAAELIYEIEGIVVPLLQLARPDLLFLHAACLRRGHSACLLVGPSGAGKSTLCWALCQRGFSYFSDELAPLQADGGHFVAHRYDHALCLKQRPPAPFDDIPEYYDGGRTWHLPMPVADNLSPPISHIFHITYNQHGDTRSTGTPVEITLASAAQRLYGQVLNALAHPQKGLPVSVALASSVHNRTLPDADLDTCCRQIRQCMDTQSGT